MIPVRRNYKAQLSYSRVADWNAHGRFTTHFLNGLSGFFPEGERFFLDSVIAYRKDLQHIPDMEKKIVGFVGQEVMHGRMHDQYNEALKLAGYPVEHLEKLVGSGLKLIQKIASKRFQLALTVAAEHYTATMANYLLDININNGAEESYQWLWLVHAIEEVEHRSVSFDVYEAAGGDYKTRMIAYFLASLVLFPSFVLTQLAYILSDKNSSIFNAKEWVSWLTIFAQLIKHISPEMVRFISPSYHPDNMKVCLGYEHAKKAVQFS